MRINRRTIALMGFCCVLLTACRKFLEVPSPKSLIKSADVFNSDVTATSAMYGIYTNMLDPGSFSGGHSSSLTTTVGLSCDELINYPRDWAPYLELQANQIGTDNNIILDFWRSMYKAIYQANAILSGLSQSSAVSLSVKEQLEGEALFIRAFSHFYLINLFGPVPLITTSDYKQNAIAPRAAVDVVYNQIIEDLEKAVDLLPEKYVAAKQERIRPNKFAVMALLSRVYLYTGNWQKAETFASGVIDRTDIYALCDTVGGVFLKASKEAIWQLRPTNVDGENGYTNEAAFFANGNALTTNVLTDTIYHSFEEKDERRRVWVASAKDGPTTVYYPDKYKHYDMTEIKEYSMVLRLAELYLIRAEARLRLGVLTGANSARNDINVIRRRAQLDEITASSESALISAISNERKHEFFAEWGHRWLDLKRLGMAMDTLSGIKDNITVEDLLYPIPGQELINNPFLGDQNPGY